MGASGPAGVARAGLACTRCPPYGGGSGGAKSTGDTGFYSVPEVGERVLVEFLGD